MIELTEQRTALMRFHRLLLAIVETLQLTSKKLIIICSKMAGIQEGICIQQRCFMFFLLCSLPGREPKLTNRDKRTWPCLIKEKLPEIHG